MIVLALASGFYEYIFLFHFLTMPTSLNCCWVFCNGIILYSHSNRKCSIIRTTHGSSAFIYLNTIKSWITFPHPHCCIGSLHFLHTLLLMAGGFSSHFSLGQPEITILKSLDWFTRLPMWLFFGQWVPAGSWASTNEQFKSHRWKQARPDSLHSIQVTPSERALVKTRSLCSMSELSPS